MAYILIIDDDEKIRTIFERSLTGQGHVVTCAEEGREGLLLVNEEPPDLVVTDIMMPTVDGLEVILSLRKNHPELPVIAISGGMHAMPMDFLIMAENFGAVKVLHKPIQLNALHAAVDETLASIEI